MLDMHNLSWKINLVEKGIGKPDALLPTYETERRGVAQQLIKFDHEYSRLFSGKSPNAQQLTDDQSKAKKLGAVDAQKFIEVCVLKFVTIGCDLAHLYRYLNPTPDSLVALEQSIRYPPRSLFCPDPICLERVNLHLPSTQKVVKLWLANVCRRLKLQEQWMQIL